jgi:hypothetical protein
VFEQALESIEIRILELLRIKNHIVQVRSLFLEAEATHIERLLRSSSVGRELLDLNYMPDSWAYGAGRIDEGNQWLPSVNIALAVELVKFLVLRRDEPAFNIIEVSPARRLLEPSRFIDIVASKSGAMLLSIFPALRADVPQRDSTASTTHPMWTWVQQMLCETCERKGELNRDGDKDAPDELTCWMVCDALIQLKMDLGCQKHPPRLAAKFAWAVESVNRSVEKLRHKARRQRTVIRLWEQPAKLREMTGRQALESLWEANLSRLLVLRMDLGMLPDARPGAVGPYYLRDLFVKFQNNLRFKPLVFKRLQGVLWRLVQSSDTTWHYHCLFVLDGALCGQHSQYAQLIGDYWQSIVPMEHGWFRDCANHPSPDVRAGIGLYERADQGTRDAFINAVLPYFAQFDLYVSGRIPRLVQSNLTFKKRPKLFGFRRIRHTEDVHDMA